MRIGPVERGVDVETPGEHEAVETVEDRLRRGIRLDLRCEQHARAADGGDRVEVHVRQERGPHVPHALLRALQVGGQSDDRSSASHRRAHAAPSATASGATSTETRSVEFFAFVKMMPRTGDTSP